MTIEIPHRDALLNIRDHLQSGAFGQRQVWERQLEAAAHYIEDLQKQLRDGPVKQESFL